MYTVTESGALQMEANLYDIASGQKVQTFRQFLVTILHFMHDQG